MAYAAYAHFMEQGRLPREIDDMDMSVYIRILGWRGQSREPREAPRQRFIDDFT